MAFAAGGACFETQLAAVTHIASFRVGEVHATPGGLYSLAVTNVTASNYRINFVALDGGPAIASVVVAVTPQTCQLLSTAEAVEAVGLVFVAWATVFAVKFLGRAFWR